MFLNLPNMAPSVAVDFFPHILRKGAVNTSGICLEPHLACRVAQAPIECVEDVVLHMVEYGHVVYAITIAFQVGCARLVRLHILILGCDKQSNTPYKLVLALIDDALGYVAVHKVYCKKEGFRSETIGRVQPCDKLNERAAHREQNFAHCSMPRLSEIL